MTSLYTQALQLAKEGQFAELNALVAENVMKLRVVHETWAGGKCHSWSIGEPHYVYTDEDAGGALTNPLPNYSEDIAAAFEVVERVGLFREGDKPPLWNQMSLTQLKGGQWSVGFLNVESCEWESLATANTAPLAIVLAALKTIDGGGK